MVPNSAPNECIHDESYWRDLFLDYYKTHAPDKVTMVNDKMMSKWAGKYELLMSNLIKKYESEPNKGSKCSANSKYNLLIQAATPALLPRDPSLNIVEAKSSCSLHGLETSTFTVCARVRPLLKHELTDGTGDEVTFAAAVPGKRSSDTVKDVETYNEELLLHTPKLSIRGAATLDTLSESFDYVFGPESTNQEVYDLACAPLVKRALNGQVGVIFAYGQTGSGKTHSMSGILEIISSSAIFSDTTDVTFSYMEMLGRDIKDCLSNGSGDDKKRVQIGEGLNGDVLVRNLSSHDVVCASQLLGLIQIANSTRSTAATAKNESSSRSHGVAILKVTNKKTSVEGTLFVIDLAGSESAKDSKSHDSARMKETKEINSSLMVLKECIRARTNAAAEKSSNDTHVPYRRNKLTLLMKDVFDIGCSRLCSTVVLANCSPLVGDISHTKNTIKYAAPLRVAAVSSYTKPKNMELDIHDPAWWTNDQVVHWVESIVGGNTIEDGTINSKEFVNSLSGVQFCSLSENEFYSRAEAQACKDGDDERMMNIAKQLYLAMWTLIVDAKTRKRRPDGSIVTPEEEEEDRKLLEFKTIEKANMWAEREKHLCAAE